MRKEIAVFFSIFIASICFAENSKYLSTAINRFNESIVKVGSAGEKCRDEKRVLPGDLFDKIDASNDEKKIALAYYYFKTITDCTNDAVKDYLLASAVRMLADKDMPRGLRDADGLIVSTHLEFLKAEIKYNTISDEHRKYFAEIKELNLPFSPIKSAKALGLN